MKVIYCGAELVKCKLSSSFLYFFRKISLFLAKISHFWPKIKFSRVEDVAAVHALGREVGRDLGVFTTTYVVCRPTKKEAEEYHHYYANEHADWPAVDRLMDLQGLHAKSFPPEAFQLFRERFAGGHGVYPLIGDPDTVADELARISAAGFTGATVTFVNYVKELPFFVQEVLPRLERKGLRLPV